MKISKTQYTKQPQNISEGLSSSCYTSGNSGVNLVNTYRLKVTLIDLQQYY